MRRFIFTAVVLMLLAVTALPNRGFAQAAPARVRVMHASPNAPAVDVYVNGQRVLSDVPFFAVSDYLSLPAGQYRAQVTPAGQSVDAAVIDATATVEGGKDYTIAAINMVDKIQAAVFGDDNSAPMAGMARVRIIHASPDAPAVDIRAAGTTTNAVNGLAFGKSVYAEVPAGTYQFDLLPAGSSQVAFTTPALRFENGWVYTLVASGELSRGNFWVQSRVDRIGR